MNESQRDDLQQLQPCRSPYCECSHGQCRQAGYYDARSEPWTLPVAGEVRRAAEHKLDWYNKMKLDLKPSITVSLTRQQVEEILKEYIRANMPYEAVSLTAHISEDRDRGSSLWKYEISLKQR